MTIYTPYFYIIQEISTGIYYAGARWAKGCHPDELLKENGYWTSSKIVNKLLEENGLESFTIRKIRFFETPEETLNYEINFLLRVKAKNNNRFYNMHNGDLLLPYGSEGFITYMIRTYGVKNCSSIDWVKEKKKETKLKNFGDENYNNREKAKETNNKKYGGNAPFCSKSVIEKFEDDNMEKYGYKWPMEREDVREKRKKTFMEKYGADIPLKNPAVKLKAEKTLIEKHNCEHNSQIESVKNSKRQKEQIKLNRSELDLLLTYSILYEIKLGGGWRQRKDLWVYNKLEELYNNYGPLSVEQVQYCVNLHKKKLDNN